MLTRRHVVAAIAVCAITLSYVPEILAQAAAPAAAPAASSSQRVIRGPDGKPMIVRPGQPPMPI